MQLKDLLDFWRKTDPETGKLIHDFHDPDWNTRFLGDLYQDLSEAARKRYALLQTPDFIERIHPRPHPYPSHRDFRLSRRSDD